MTRRDLLDDNVDLLARAARLIRQRPSFQLSVTPVSGEGARGIVVSAASKVPSSKAGPAISRLDIYVNGRPVRSIDAANGTVPTDSGGDRQGGQHAHGRRSAGVGSRWKTCRLSPDGHSMMARLLTLE